MVSEEINQSNIIDIDLSQTQQKTIRIDGDDSKTIKINLSDLNVMSRVKEVYPKMMEMAQKASLAQVESEEENIDNLVSMLNDIDNDMRGFTDYIFNADICSQAASDGTMYDLFNGRFRFEIIIESLLSLYTDNINLEFRKMNARLKNHGKKYSKK